MHERPSHRAALLNRRAFLTRAASSLVVLAVGIPVSCGDGVTQRVLVADPALCGACFRCAITCAELLGEPLTPNLSLPKPERVYQAHVFVDAGWYAETCHMCPEQTKDGALVSPACVAVCSSGAAQIARPGDPRYGDVPVRFVDADRCVGCGMCAKACPYAHPLVLEGLARKCDLCVGRYDTPACVAECPASALRLLDFYAASAPRPFPWED